MDSLDEYDRYLNVKTREIDVPNERLQECLKNRSALVLGATGCVGSALLEQLEMHDLRKIVGAGLEGPTRKSANVDYQIVDIRSASDVKKLFARTEPDLVFHLAAQRDPGLAEHAVAQTVDTNVLGTANAVETASECGVRDFVYASTGKAMRPYTRDVYAASKKVAEWVVAKAGKAGGLAVTIARFTHIVDNSIALSRFRTLCATGNPLPVHDPKAVFYAQSATESAQLLLTSVLAGRQGLPAICAINNLEWPFQIIDIAGGVQNELGRDVDLNIIGEQPGYEQAEYFGLLGTEHFGDVSPLINALEARLMVDIAVPGVDVALVEIPGSSTLDEYFNELVGAGISECDDGIIKNRVDKFLCEHLRATLANVPQEFIARMLKWPILDGVPKDNPHALISDLIRERLAG
ncbi:polysaccharide biosynthesis protein [Mycolicibacterium neoaurum]|uniref:polysaccharide biosynthesis protein n=1 Tax=Mycolicibacterium neoaurum TaxID=1795 RepID=UPI001F4CA60A|nr:polysaccharide biosynthesis protein [Mycolicibacterium neoaurum]